MPLTALAQPKVRRARKRSGYEQVKHLIRRIKCPAIGFPDSVPGRGVAFDGPVALARSELISFSAQLAG